MIFAIEGQGASLADRVTIAQAILDENAAVLDAHVAAGTIIPVRDDPDPAGLCCIYCHDSLQVVHAQSWFYRHAEINDCVEEDNYLGVLNPPSRGG